MERTYINVAFVQNSPMDISLFLSELNYSSNKSNFFSEK